MLASAPLWLKLMLRLERAVGGPVEAAVHNDAYFDLVAELSRGTRRLTDAVESVSKRGLHLLNLPAGTDIRRVREQLARMDRRLMQISKEVEQLERGSGSDDAADPGAPLTDHVRDQSGALRDLMILAQSVEAQWSAMSVAGIADEL